MRTVRTASFWAAFLLLAIIPQLTIAQTSWKGTTSTIWSTASNWTAGVPTSSTDAIIGDANFTGINQPTISSTSNCKSLTIGGVVTTILTLSKNLVVSGNLTINTNGSLSQNNTSLTVSGNWINNGTYTAGNNNSRVFFSGVAQSLGGSSVTTFRKLTINTGSTLTLAANVSVSGNGSSITVNGTVNPNESPSYTITASNLTLSNNGKLKVNAATFAGNYNISGSTSINAGSIVEYSAATINQTVSNSLTYSTLLISGAGIKTLAGSLPALNSSAATVGNIFVTGGTFDLSVYTANRGTSVTGGEISIGSGAILKIGGTNSFPFNYTTKTMTLNSTVEYCGTNQTVSAQTYGNLTLCSSSGAATKTMPGTAYTIEGNFTSTVGAGTAVNYAAAADITINGNTTIGSSTTFNGGSSTLTIRGNWSNAGTFTGNTGTVNFDGPGLVISGAGTHNFNNISFSRSGITAAAGSLLNVAGNISTSGSGTFTHNSTGLITMTGASKTISGTGLTFYDLSVTGAVASTATAAISGDLTVSGSFTANSGTISMTGSSKSISGTGSKTFFELLVPGSVTTAVNLSVSSLLDVSGTFSATAGTVTFTSTSLLSGTANFFNVTVNATFLRLSAAAVMGIAGSLTITSGTVDVTTATPNTINFNGSGAQSVNAISYYNLSVSNGNTKTAAGAITVNGTLTIASSTTFNGSTFTHTILRNWVNSGTYTASSGTVQFTGPANSTLTGSTTFNTLTINKSASSNTLALADNVSAATVNMTAGILLTGSKTLTITTTRTGNGIILGTITRTHTFNIATAYAFEGPYNTITFATVVGVSSVTVTVTPGSISDYPNGSSVNREYIVSIPSGTYTATLRLHYEDAELNGNDESAMVLSKYNAGAWGVAGKTGNSTTNNYVELLSLSNISSRWTCEQSSGVARWNGSVSSDWNTAANWTTVSGGPSFPPSSVDVVQIGAGAFTNQPVISNAVTVKSITFGSVQSATLSLAAGGSLTTSGNISGTWSADATHSINVANQQLTVGGNLVLSNGTSNRSINLLAAAGTVNIFGSLTQTGNSSITYSGAGSLNIGGEFNYTSGTFSAGAGTITYNGNAAQIIAAVNYNNLSISKSAGVAKLTGSVSILGNLAISSGTMDVSGTPVTIAGNVSVSAGAILDCDGVTLNVGGNWIKDGTYISTSGTVVLNGTGAQTVSASNFNNLTISKSSGSATLSGNITLDGNLSLQAGTMDIATYTANRTTSGGTITLSGGTTLLLAGANNFPSGFITKIIDATSLVHFNGSTAQAIAGINYGNVRFSNGSANEKTLSANMIVSGDMFIDNGATLNSGGFAITLSGNWNNSGTFSPGSGTVIFNGVSKTITGNTVFNRMTINGSYTVAGSDITHNGVIIVSTNGSYNAGSGTATVNNDLTNNGTLLSSGTTNFSGTSLQTIRLVNALTSTSTGIINFNGNISPVLNSNSSPQFATLNINNTAGINASVGWTVHLAMNVNSGGVFNGGLSAHTIYGSFANNGTVTSTGTMNFTPTTAKTVNLGASGFSSTGKVYFGGSGQLSLAGTSTKLTHVIISNTNSAGIAPVSNWTIDSNFTITSDAKFIAGNYTYTLAGNIESDGELVGGSSTFVMSSPAGTLTASSVTEFNHFTVAGTITPLTDYRVAGNFSNNGTYDGTIGALIMTGSNAATIGGTVTPSPIGILVIEKSGGAVVTQTVDINSVLILSINSGVLFTSTRSIAQDAGGGILLIANDATLRLGGTNSLPGFSGYSLDINSNVDYAGTTQTVGNAANYGNLLITATGNKNAWVPVLVQGSLLISAGTLSTSTLTVTHTIAGNFIMTGGSITGTSSTYVLNGANDQTLTLLSNIVNLTINKATGVVNLGANATVNNVTNFTAGKINLGNYNYTVGTSGSIANYSPLKYFIASGNGALIQRVTAGGNKFFPVGFSSDYLPATIALTAGSTADNFNVRLLNSVYYNGTAGLQYNSHVVNATWMIDEAVAGGSDATVTLQWPQALELSGFNRNSCRIAHYTAAMWDLGTADLAAGGSNPYSVSRSGFTSFSPFAIETPMVLPVTWLTFIGKNENKNNILNWTVANEQNNDHYIVEASTNGNNFLAIGKLKGAGTTATEQRYGFTHYAVTEPVYYYRIRQVDTDGRYSYSKVVKIAIGNFNVNEIKLISAPGQNTVSFAITASRSFSSSMIITDMSGKVVYQQKIKVEAGSNTIDLANFNAATGVYNAVLSDANGRKLVLRFVK